MRRAAVILGVCLALLAADTSPARQVPVEVMPPRISIFYYAW